ncbi:sulfotransferase family 2 domain-containing protein [Thioclava litoralis]
MIVSHGRRYIFVHIPKTGGTALALSLEARAMAQDLMLGDTPKAQRRRKRLAGIPTAGRKWKHTTLADGIGLYTAQQAHSYFTFTLVRNPWDRLVSYYHWLQDQAFAHPAVQSAQQHDFRSFLSLPHIQRSLSAHPYTSYMQLPDGEVCCRAFLRLEHLAEDIAPLEAHLGFALSPLPVANSSRRRRDYRSYYDSALAELVGQVCAADIARFGYRFED